ncbi:MAG: hypothetical protein RIT45_4356 [Pseudomonadota bacterium]
MIKYLGSKRALLPLLVATVRALDAEAPVRTVADLFSGTARVGHALKGAGYRVRANDHNAYAETLARCYVVADRERHAAKAERMLRELERLPGRPGWFTATYAEQARYFSPENAARIEAMRAQIEAWAPGPELRAVLLTSLVEAADRVDSTVGVQMAYLKSWAPRARRPIALRVPDLLPRAPHGKGSAHGLDAAVAAHRLRADVAYLDPPYNQHSYLGNYHVWETLVRWDAPEVYGIACKRVDVQQRKSAFNSKRLIGEAFDGLVQRCVAERLVVSFSDEGALSYEALVTALQRRGHVTVLSRGHERYIGHQIGVYNPQGERVGSPGKARNIEYVFVVTPEPFRGGAALQAAGHCDAVTQVPPGSLARGVRRG